MEEIDFLVIGGGPAGYAGAIYAARFMLKTVVVAKEKGGLLTTTHIVENYPGITSITGWDLMDQFEDHVKDYDIPIIQDAVVSVEKKGKVFYAKTAGGKEFVAKSILIATGNKRRELNVPGEKEHFNKGVSYCVTCDAPLFKGKDCAVIGGGDSAVKESLLLAEHASHVYIIARSVTKAEPINDKRMRERDNITVLEQTQVKEMFGDGVLSGVKLDKPFNGSDVLSVQGCFVEIGWLPQNELGKQLGLELNQIGEIVRDLYSKTNVPGVFAAGDVCDTHFKQAIVSAAEGSIAADSANAYLKNEY